MFPIYLPCPPKPWRRREAWRRLIFAVFQPYSSYRTAKQPLSRLAGPGKKVLFPRLPHIRDEPEVPKPSADCARLSLEMVRDFRIWLLLFEHCRKKRIVFLAPGFADIRISFPECIKIRTRCRDFFYSTVFFRADCA